jgi:hypothetical protein
MFQENPSDGTSKLFVMGRSSSEVSSYKYLGMVLRSDISWADQVNYTMKKVWKALRFRTRILKNGNSNSKSLAYTSLVRSSL